MILIKKATYCFVEFRDEDSARTAILDVNGKTVCNCSLSIINLNQFPNDPSGRARFNLAFANSPNHMSVQ